MTLSKSEYMMFLKHPAWLWLKKHDKSKLPEVTDSIQARFDAGHEFEKYAEELFLNGIKLGFNSYDEYLSLPERTEEAIKNGAKVIFQGRFEANNITCIIDVLEKNEDGSFNLVEIKSATSIKDEYVEDLSFQNIVLQDSGLEIKSIRVACVNNEYIKQGEIVASEFVSFEDVTDRVEESMMKTRENIARALKVAGQRKMPDPSPRFVNTELFDGTFSEWIDIFEELRPGTLDPQSIYYLAGINPKKIGILEDMGITRINDIPDDFDFNKTQRFQFEAVKGADRVLDADNIKEFLNNLQFPLYFFDYETAQSLVPIYDGTNPYAQIPFQYSLHILETPGGELVHKEFLHTDSSNPILPLLEQLKQDIGKVGTVLAWHMSFEKSRNSEMAEMFPEYKDFIDDLNSRIQDLKIPFSKHWLVDKDFYGSASLKKVLPVMVPELSYKILNIQRGDEAQSIWMNTFLSGKEVENKEQIIDNLKKYCELDTFAMVEIWRRLREIINI